MSISDSWKWDGHTVPQIVRRPQEAKRPIGRHPDLDLNYSSGAGVHQAATDFLGARENTISPISKEKRSGCKFMRHTGLFLRINYMNCIM